MLLDFIHADPNPASRLPRYGECLYLLTAAARADWRKVTGTDVDIDIDNKNDDEAGT